MKISVLTLYPEFYNALSQGVLGRVDKNILDINIVNIRDFSLDKHKRCDDTPFGGGSGMVMTPGPLHDSINFVDENRTALRIYLSPKGEVFNQKMAVEFSKYDHIVLVNGCFEGIDQRIISLDIDREISIGDYVLTSGDPASLVVINATARLLEGVLGSSESLDEESFNNNLLEYPHYTRPKTFMGMSVPEVLLSGNHKEISEFRKKESISVTKEKRPDLLKETNKE